MSSLLLSEVHLPGHVDVHDVLIQDGLIVAVHPAGTSLVGTITADQVERVSADGRWLIPGLWDHHVHFDQWAQVSRRLDLSAAGSAAEAAHLVARWIEAKADELDLPIVGYGFRDALWSDAPALDVLDPITGDRPAVLVSADLHSAWLNTAALNRFGHAGHPTGLLREDVAMAVLSRVSAVSDEVSDAWAAAAADQAARRGVVGVVDLERPIALETWRRRITAGQRSLRVRSGVWAEVLDDAIGRGLRTGQSIDGTDGLLQVGPMKVITDGSLNTRTAYCHDSYPGLTGNPNGLLLVPPGELIELLRHAAEHGFRCAVHAIGDQANSLALQAFSESGAVGSIEHAQLLDQADVGRFAELGVVASVQPEHALDDRDVADRLWAGRTGRAFMLRSLLDAGAVLALGSDAPVAPLDPWISLSAAVARTRDGRPAWHPEQSITPAEALSASVAESSRQPIAIAVGDVADLVLCEADPLATEPMALRTMPVWATLLGGRFTYRAD